MFEIIAAILQEKIKNITVRALVILNSSRALTKNILFSQIAVRSPENRTAKFASINQPLPEI